MRKKEPDLHKTGPFLASCVCVCINYSEAILSEKETNLPRERRVFVRFFHQFNKVLFLRLFKWQVWKYFHSECVCMCVQYTHIHYNVCVCIHINCNMILEITEISAAMKGM